MIQTLMSFIFWWTLQLVTRMATTVIGQIEPFQVGMDDLEKYTERLEQYFVANGIANNAKKVVVLVTTMGSKACILAHEQLSSSSKTCYQDLCGVSSGHEGTFEAHSHLQSWSDSSSTNRTRRKGKACPSTWLYFDSWPIAASLKTIWTRLSGTDWSVDFACRGDCWPWKG